jgi:urea transport system permease protein
MGHLARALLVPVLTLSAVLPLSVVLMLSVLLTFSATLPSLADAALYQALATDKFDQMEKAVAALAASGDAQAPEAIAALAEGRLSFDPKTKVLYFTKDGATIEAATGSVVAPPPAGLKKMRVNNRVRRAIDAAQGAMTLLSPDPVRRFAAAQAVLKSRDATALPVLEQAIAGERDPRALPGCNRGRKIRSGASHRRSRRPGRARPPAIAAV